MFFWTPERHVLIDRLENNDSFTLKKKIVIWTYVDRALPGPEVTKLFSCSAQLNMKFILLINVKMPTIVGILTFISMINTSESLKSRIVFIF